MPDDPHSTEDRPDSRVRSLGPRVRARREALGLRQSELAERAGCSARFVHTLETGKPTLRLDKVLDVLNALGLELRLVPGPGGSPVDSPP